MYDDIFSYDSINAETQTSPNGEFMSSRMMYKDSIKLITPRLAAGTLRNGDSQGEQANAPLESPSARIYFAQAKYNQGKNTPGLAPGIFIAFACLKSMGETDAGCGGRGWKLQLSINEQDLPNAWLIVKDILIEYRITESKVIKQGYSLERPAPCEQGKQITIYACYDSTRLHDRWTTMLEQITDGLGHAGIRPSYRPAGCAYITGSNYVSYRNDFNPKRKGRAGQKNYLSAEDSLRYGDRAYNPFDDSDGNNPFRNINITQAVQSVPQPPIPERGEAASAGHNLTRG